MHMSSDILIQTFTDKDNLTDIVDTYISNGVSTNSTIKENEHIDLTVSADNYKQILVKILAASNTLLAVYGKCGDSVILPKRIAEYLRDNSEYSIPGNDSEELFKLIGVIAGLGTYQYENAPDNKITVLHTDIDSARRYSITFDVTINE